MILAAPVYYTHSITCQLSSTFSAFSLFAGRHGAERRLHHLRARRAGAGQNQKNMRRVREIACAASEGEFKSEFQQALYMLVVLKYL